MSNPTCEIHNTPMEGEPGSLRCIQCIEDDELQKTAMRGTTICKRCRNQLAACDNVPCRFCGAPWHEHEHVFSAEALAAQEKLHRRAKANA